MAIAGELNPFCEALFQIVDEPVCVLGPTAADMPRRDKFGIGINRNPSPRVADAVFAFKASRNVGLLALGEGPYFINLKHLAWQVAHHAVVVFGACLARLNYQTGHRPLTDSGHSDRAADAASFNQAGNNLRPLFSAQLVHGVICTHDKRTVNQKELLCPFF